MNASEKEIVTAISNKVMEHGGRMTKARHAVILYVLRSRTPLSVQEIVDHVSIDEVSVYRIVAFFKQLGIFEEILFRGGVQRYAFAHGHHHHVICTGCAYVAHISCDSSVPNQPKKVPNNFVTITDHSVTYYGLCSACSA